MQHLSFILSSVVVSGGIGAGMLLIKRVHEEQKPLLPHFKIAQKIVAIMIVLSCAVAFFSNSLLLMALSLGSGALLLVKKRIPHFGALGILLFLSSQKKELFFLVSVLIFIYGMIYAARTGNRRTNTMYRFLSSGSALLFVANGLFMLSYLVTSAKLFYS